MGSKKKQKPTDKAVDQRGVNGIRQERQNECWIVGEFFLPLQQVILIASDQSAEETRVLPLPSPHRTDCCGFILKGTLLTLKVIGSSKDEGKPNEALLLLFLHAYHQN